MADTYSVIIIDDDGTEHALPECSKMSQTTSTLVDSARNSKGYVIGSVIRSAVAKVEMTWNYLTPDQWASIISLFVDDDTGELFYRNVRFFNQATNNWEEKTMYCGDRKAGMWRKNPETGEVMGWTDCKMNLIEV